MLPTFVKKKIEHKTDQAIKPPRRDNVEDWFNGKFFEVCLLQNFTTSAIICNQPCLPIKLIPRRFWPIAINFLSKNKKIPPPTIIPNAIIVKNK